jgi:hypothetical protein
MASLPVITWVRFLVWLDLGMLIYWFYGRTHSPLVNQAERLARSAVEGIGNFVCFASYLILFNGFCITVLAYLTELGVTTENSAKWHEIAVTAEQADSVGWTILGIGIAVLAAGHLLRKLAPNPKAA